MITPIRPPAYKPGEPNVIPPSPIATALQLERDATHRCRGLEQHVGRYTVVRTGHCAEHVGHLDGSYLPTACGCRVTGNGTLQHPLMVEPCPDHFAAMYPRLAQESQLRAGIAGIASAAIEEARTSSARFARLMAAFDQAMIDLEDQGAHPDSLAVDRLVAKVEAWAQEEGIAPDLRDDDGDHVYPAPGAVVI